MLLLVSICSLETKHKMHRIPACGTAPTEGRHWHLKPHSILVLTIEGYGGGGLPYRWNHTFSAIILLVSFSTSFTSAFSSSRHDKIRTSISRQKEDPYSQSLMIFCKSSNRYVLYEGQNSEHDKIVIQSAIPMEPLPSSQYVQQEQLLEVVSRIGADSIASLSISERTKRAMLAEAVEDEIFFCTEQMIDLVNEQLEHDTTNSNSDNNQSASKTRPKKNIEVEMLDLRERNQFLQTQYNDLVSGRPSSLLNTVNSIGGSTNLLNGSNSPMIDNDDDDGQSKSGNDDASQTQFH